MPCLSPYSIPNPNYGLQDIGLNYLKDCDSQMIAIPCGHCSSCVAVKQMYFVQRVQMEATKNHLFMATLTYNPESLPVMSVGDYDIPYADKRDLSLMIKRLRNDNVFPRPFRHISVSEFGGLKGRPHFHVLFLLPKYPGDTFNDCLKLQSELYPLVLKYWVRNVAYTYNNKGDLVINRRNPDYRPLCTFRRRIIRGQLRSNYDLHYCNAALTSSGLTDVAFYVLKYMLKDSDRAVRLQQALHLNYDEDTYHSIWDSVKPGLIDSLGFGLNAYRPSARSRLVFDPDIVSYLHDCIKKTPVGSPYPFYFSPENGMSFPLAPYYRRFTEIYSEMDMHTIWFNSRADFAPEKSREQIEMSIQRFIKQRDLLQTDDYSDFLDEFYD